MPVVDLDANNSSGTTAADYTASFTEGGSPVLIGDADATVFDSDSANLTKLVITLTNPQDGVNEILAANTAGTSISASYDSGTGVLTLSGVDTVAHYRQVLRTVTYENSEQNPDTTQRIITVVASDAANDSVAATAYINVNAINDAPSLSTPTLTISEGQTVTLTSSNIQATDAENSAAAVVITVNSVTSGHFALAIDPSTPITAFTQLQVNGSAVVFVHNGGEAAPTFSLTASDGTLSDGPKAGTITFTNGNDAPSLTTNSLTIPEGATIVLTSSHINGSDSESGPAGLTYSVSSLSGGQFELVAVPGTAITSFTQAQINGGAVRFAHDGGEAAPAYALTLSDGSASVGPFAAAITFTNVNDAPTIGVNTLTISEGSTVILGMTHISTSDPDNTPAQLTYTVSNISGGQFEYVALPGAAITSFAQTQINTGEVQFVHDGGDLAPAYDLTVSDGALSHGPNSASITFNAINDAPTISAIASQTIDEDTTLGPIVFSVGDSETAATSLVMTATSSDGTRIPNGNIVLGGSGANRTITITPALNQNGGPVTITLSVSDGVTSTQTTFDVTITPVNDAPTISPASFNVLENTPNGFVFGTMSSGDVDAGDTRTYAIIGGDPTGAFAIDSTTGALRVADSAQLDYETTSGWTLTIEVRDAGGLTATTAVPIALVDANDNSPVITSNAGGDTASISVSENNTAVTTVAATDADSGPGVTYGISGDDVGLFQIDTNTGVLTFLAAPDYESPQDLNGNNVYEVTVVATDGLYSDTQDLTITVADSDEYSITGISDSNGLADTVAENVALGTPVGVTAFADDLDGTDTVSYSLLNDAGGLFAIDPVSGVVTVAGAINYESSPSHTIRVEAQSTDGTSTTRDFTITVTDVNESATTAISDTDVAGETLSENLSVGSSVGVTAFADDLDGTDTVSYSLLDDAGGLFAIDPTSGVVTLNTVLDYETATSHSIQVQALSTDGSSTSRVFTITVTDVNEFTTTALSDTNPGVEQVAENAVIGTPVGVTAFADDLDGTDTVSYSLLDDAGGLFTIDSASGVMTLAATLDYESATTHTIRVQALSTDGSATTRDFVTAVTDVNEYTASPISDNDVASETLAENLSVASTVGVTAFADDLDGTDSVSYSLLDDAGGLFAIDPLTGVVTLAQSLDYETGTSHTIQVQALSTDGSSTTRDFTFSITDVNEYATTPVSDADAAAETVTENVTVGTPVGIIAFADDLDGTDTISYSPLNDAGGLFAIDPVSGVVTVDGTIDYESGTSHTIRVQALSTDGSTAFRDFTIAITNVNEYATTAISDTDAAGETLAESLAVGSAVGVTAFADDLDGTDTISYSLLDNAGGLFAIDPQTGVVTLSASLDYETSTAPTIQVEALSTDGSATTRDFTFTITDVNEFATTAISDTNGATETVAENATAGTPVGITAFADDLDGTDTVSYSLLNDAGGLFAIDPVSGVVSVAGAIDYESATSHTIRIQALSTDGTSTFRDFTTTVTDVNEYATTVIGDTNPAVEQVAENAVIGTPVGVTTFADDLDGTDTVSYSLTVNPGNKIAIDPTTGVVTVAGTIDFEATTTLAFTVQALSTDGSSTTRDFVIVVTDLNDNAPVVTAGQSFSLPENSGNSTWVGTLLASDVDTVWTLQNWTITGGTGAAAFAINAATGEITVLDGSLLNFEATPSLTLLVTVSDGVATSAVQTVTINLTNVNEAPQIAGPANTSVNEDGTTAALPITISDVDTAATSLIVTATSSDPALIANSNILIGGTGANRTVTISPTADLNGGPVTITLTVSDGALSTQTTFLVTVNAVNDAPTMAVVPNQTIDEDATSGPLAITVGDIDTDVNALTVTATSSDQALIPDGNLVVSGTGASRTITVTPLADQNGGPVTITLTVSDGGLTTVRTFTVDVTPVNDLPVIAPQGFNVNENSPTDTIVGTVIASDIDAGAVLTYAIDAGNTNGAFAIDAVTGQITVANPAALNFEATPQYLLTVSVTDSFGVPQTATITIDLNDLNEVPTSLSLSNASIDENSPVGTLVGQLSSTDVDAGDSVTYSLVDDAGGLFAIDQLTGEITVNGALDFETSTNHTIIARVTDAGGLVLDRSFLLSLVDLNETPVLVGGAFGLPENSLNGTLVGTISASDVDAGDSLTFSLISGNTGGAFTIDAITGAITVANTAVLDFETNGTFTLTAQVTDRAGLTHQQSVTVTLSDLNEQPTLLAGTYSINEWSSIGSLVGLVSASDVDAGDSLTYAFVAGNTGGRFAIDPLTGEITVADAANFTHETQSSFTITVQVRDLAGLTHSADMTIVVDNVNVPPVAVNDLYALDQFQTLTTATITGVIANDSDSDSASITASLGQGPQHGTLTFNADGSFTYVPDDLYFGFDSFTYLLTDGLESSSVATVSLTVNMVAPGGGGLTDESDNSSDNTSDASEDEGTDTGDTDEVSTDTDGASGPAVTSPTSSLAPGGRVDATAAVVPPSATVTPDDFFLRNDRVDGLESGSRDSLTHRSVLRGPLHAVSELIPVIQGLIPAPLQDLTAAILENPVLWNELNSMRDQLESMQDSSAFAEDIVVGTTTAVTGGLTVGYVIWLIRGGSLLATMVSVMPTWMSFDPLPVMDRFEEEKSEEDQESLASIVSGTAGTRR